jgi:hypothetical protein
MHPKRTGSSVEAAVIETEPALAYVGDSDAEWHDAETTAVLTPRQDRPLGGVCLVEAETPVEIKGCIPEQQNGSGTTPGRWYIKRESHDQLHAAGGVYYLAVYAPRPSTPVIAALVVPAATVGDLLDGSWYENGRREVAKLSWPRVIDETEVQR